MTQSSQSGTGDDGRPQPQVASWPPLPPPPPLPPAPDPAQPVGTPPATPPLWRTLSAWRWLAAGLAVVALAELAAIGWLLWSAGGQRAVPGTVQARILSLEDASVLVGTTLTAATSHREPPRPQVADPATCAVAVGPATRSVYTRGWTVFLSATYQDSEAVADHTVTQVLGVYPDGNQAGTVFQALTDGVRGCTSAVRTDAAQHATAWVYTVEAATADRLVWVSTQEDADGWTCYRQARLTGRTVVQVAVCQVGDGTEAAARIIDRVASRVS
ncbi:hypothetical protein AWW66_17120 [Micromonospora rosaria]|uniref:PknH-like extracellular domain-containing protein n=1 Tax=Micromonospora rosaria TaxID=47874 RepID=A0A136PR16_9ACTN|nr:sensor domain-containing protein [Micromonospora rosaria]KXK60784.1 hypothetical protein AWW66_17120 [Micromonospora rosaria]